MPTLSHPFPELVVRNTETTVEKGKRNKEFCIAGTLQVRDIATSPTSLEMAVPLLATASDLFWRQRELVRLAHGRASMAKHNEHGMDAILLAVENMRMNVITSDFVGFDAHNFKDFDDENSIDSSQTKQASEALGIIAQLGIALSAMGHPKLEKIVDRLLPLQTRDFIYELAMFAKAMLTEDGYPTEDKADAVAAWLFEFLKQAEQKSKSSSGSGSESVAPSASGKPVPGTSQQESALGALLSNAAAETSLSQGEAQMPQKPEGSTNAAYHEGKMAYTGKDADRFVEEEAKTFPKAISERMRWLKKFDSLPHVKFQWSFDESAWRALSSASGAPTGMLPKIVVGNSLEGGHWEEMLYVSPPLTEPSVPPKRSKNRRVASEHGAVPMYMNRYATDGHVFARKARRDLGGSILLDKSGSMSVTHEAVAKLLEHAPAAVIACYSSNDVKGYLVKLAEKGRRISKERFRELSFGGGNGVDGPALQWLMKQPEPRYWISDGGVCSSVGVQLGDLLECYDYCTRGRITQVRHIDHMLDILRGDKPKPKSLRINGIGQDEHGNFVNQYARHG